MVEILNFYLCTSFEIYGMKHSSAINTFTFRRWTRRSWAVFNSLSRSIRIGVLSISFSIISMAGYGQQRPDTLLKVPAEEAVDIEGITVSDSRPAAVQSELLRVVQVITRAEIEQAAVSDVAGLLETLPGIDIRQRGAAGAQADISIRGGNFNQTLILLNGINLNNPQTGHHNLDLPIDLSSVQRIEILQGPGARKYGADAFCGAINIVAGEPQPLKANAKIAASDYGTFSIGANASIPLGNTFHFAGVNSAASNGYTSNTDTKSSSIFYRSRIKLNAFSVDLQGGYSSKAFGANSFYTPKYPDQFEATRSFFGALKVIPSAKLHLEPQIFWRRHSDRFELFRNDAPAWYQNHNYHLTDVAGASLRWSQTKAHSRKSLSIDYRFEHIFSNVLGTDLANTIEVPGEPGAVFTKSFRRETLNLMADYTLHLGRFSASGGLMVSVNKSLPRGYSWYPGVDAGWQIRPDLRWFASFSRVLRLPTFTDMFYQGPTNSGNPDLQPEEAISVESGLKRSGKIVEWQCAVFGRKSLRTIDWVRFADDEKWQSMNLTQVKFAGIEMSVDIRPAQNKRNYHLPRLKLDYSWLTASKSSKGFVSMYVLDPLRHKVNITLVQPLALRAGISLSLSYQQRSGGYQPYIDGAYTAEIPWPRVWLVGLKAYYRFGWFTSSAEVTNLLNVDVVDISNVSQPGRWLMLSLSVNPKWQK